MIMVETMLLQDAIINLIKPHVQSDVLFELYTLLDKYETAAKREILRYAIGQEYKLESGGKVVVD